ncbi:hypothetical protein ABIE28_002470 [Devosia sp. 2618]
MVRSTAGLQTFRRPPFCRGRSNHIGPFGTDASQDEDPLSESKRLSSAFQVSLESWLNDMLRAALPIAYVGVGAL